MEATAIGTTVGGYRITKYLGRGAMGEVYLAEDDRIGQKVAIKRLLASDDPAAMSAILDEARAAVRLDHPNIARLISVIESDGQPNLIMEFVEGRTLSEVLRGGPLDPQLVTSIGIQLADALDSAHSARVHHRDLKPANIQLTDRDQIKVLDFGLAKVQRAYPGSNAATTSMNSGLSSTGGIVGTPAYIPPEMFQNQKADHRGDIYSAGITLFELATGRRPYEGADLFALIDAVRSHPIPDAHEVNPRVSPALSQAIRKSMARDPAERFQSAGEMRVAFEALRAQPTTGFPWQRVLVPLAVVVAIGLVWKIVGPPPTPPNPTPMADGPSVLAVLPVRFLGPDTLSYQALGMTDFLTARLANYRLTVLPPERPAMKDPEARAPGAVAARLGATAVLDASMLQSGDQIQVTVQLLSRDGRTIRWSDVIKGRSTELFEIHQRTLVDIVSGLQKLGAISSQSGEDVSGRPTSPPTSNRDAWDEYSQAVGFMEALDNPEKVDLAVTLFQSAISRDPRFAMAYAGLGQAYLARHKSTKDLRWLSSAREAIQTAQSLGSRQSSVRLALAETEEQLAHYAAAESIAMSVANEFPQNDEAFLRAGSALLGRGENDRALDTFDRAVQIRPEFWRNHYYRGIALSMLKRRDDAVQAMTRATVLQPDNGFAWNTLGVFRQGDGDTVGARVAYLRALHLAPRASFHSNLGKLYFDQHQYRWALDSFQNAAQLALGDPQYRRNLGDTWKEMGKADSSRAAYEECVSLSADLLTVKPDDAGTMAVGATCLAKLGRVEEALSQVDRALKLDPANRDIHYRRAGVLAMAGRRDEALTSLKEAIRRGYSTVEAEKSPDLDGIRDTREFQELVHN